MRLFVALELPQPWRDAAVAVRAGLEGTLEIEERSALRWVQPDLMHLTLRFLGEFADARVSQLQAALDMEQSDVLPLDLASTRLGSFGAANRLQVIWLGIDGDLLRLQGLVRRIEAACVDAGADPDARPFAPHITLARVRERTSAEVRRAVGQALVTVPPPSVTLRATSVALVRSHLGSGPPRYEVLSRHPRAVPSLGSQRVPHAG